MYYVYVTMYICTMLYVLYIVYILYIIFMYIVHMTTISSSFYEIPMSPKRIIDVDKRRKRRKRATDVNSFSGRVKIYRGIIYFRSKLLYK